MKKPTTNQTAYETMQYLTFALLMLAPLFASAATKPVDLVVVYKSKGLMQLVRDERVVKSYKVVFGDNPKGHKVRQGDERTPEGRYTLDWKIPTVASTAPSTSPTPTPLTAPARAGWA